MTMIDYYLGTISPWCYLAGDRLEQIAARHGAQITYKPVDLMQLFPRTGGLPPAQRHPARMAYRMQELRRWRAARGVEMTLEPAHFPTNMAPSSYAIIAAQAAIAVGEADGDLPALVQGILRACWAENRDIAQDEVIRDVLRATGFDPALTDRGLFIGAETYARNLEEAVAAGVFGAPFYIIRETGEAFWGQDRLDALDHALGQGTPPA